MSFLIAKQSIFDKEGRIVAYEVYLRKKGNVFLSLMLKDAYEKADYIFNL
jgi:EAL and modified HD-GYP domain-containing signal transduction protein